MAETTDSGKRYVAAFRKDAHDYARERGVEIKSELNHAGCAVLVHGNAVLFDRRFQEDESYREGVTQDVYDLIDSRVIVSSDALHKDARAAYTAIALVPVGVRPGLYQVAELSVVDGKIASVTRYRKHEPEMGHFALYQAAEALRLQLERSHDLTVGSDEDDSIELTPETAAILQAPQKSQASKVKL